MNLRMFGLVILLSSTGFVSLYAQKYHESTWFSGDSVQLPDQFITDDFSYDKSHHVYYRVFNTAEDILVDLFIEDEMAQRKILRLGLTVWIDPMARKKRKIGVKYPVEQSFGTEQRRQVNRPGGQGRSTFLQSKKFILEGKNEMQLTGFDGSVEPVIIPSASDEFYGQMKFDTLGNLLYRLIIPVKKVEEIIPLKEGNLLSLGFESGYLNQANMSGPRPGGNAAIRGGSPGGGRPGGGSPPGGGRPGGGNRGQMARRQQEMQQMTFPLKVWVKKIRLAEE